ncbi:MAG: arginine--tRNA ligase [Nanoarchaeota archaeon]
MPFEDEVRELLQKHLKLAEVVLEKPKADFGDLAFPCFSLAKERRKSPVEIAKEIAAELKPSGSIERIAATGPYVNFFMRKADLAKDVLGLIEKQGEQYGSSGVGKGKKLLVEHTSINPNASPHVGRARNGIIGDSIARIMAFQGYAVSRHFYVNDVGKQIAMLVMGGKGVPKFHELLDEYVRINKDVEEHPEREKEVFALLNKLEAGDKEVRHRFRAIVESCITGQAAIFKDFGITFDHYDYESDFLWSKETERVLEALRKTGKLFEDEEKRLVLDLKGFELPMEHPVFVLTRADKTSLYGLRDIAYNLHKLGLAKRNIIVLGEDQRLYFKQISAALSLLGKEPPEIVHYSFVLLSDGKMSTRQGNVVLLVDFMKEAREKAAAEIRKRDYSSDVDKIAKDIAYGAVKFSIIKVSAEKNVTFDWDIALSFEGETGPYVQYAHARICSILRKHGKLPKRCDTSLLSAPEEVALLKQLAEFPATVKQAERRPHVLAAYAYLLAKQFSDFYHEQQVLKAEEKLRDARLRLCDAVRQVLARSLFLLGINAPETM